MRAPEHWENAGWEQHVSPHSVFFFSLSVWLILLGAPVQTCEQWLLACTCIAVLFWGCIAPCIAVATSWHLLVCVGALAARGLYSL